MAIVYRSVKGSALTSAEMDNNFQELYDEDAVVLASANASAITYADGKVSDTVYGGSWNGVTTIAPSKNAVYDKIESVVTLLGDYLKRDGSNTMLGNITFANDGEGIVSVGGGSLYLGNDVYLSSGASGVVGITTVNDFSVNAGTSATITAAVNVKLSSPNLIASTLGYFDASSNFISIANEEGLFKNDGAGGFSWEPKNTIYLEGTDLYYYSHSYGVIASPAQSSSLSMTPYRLAKRFNCTGFVRSNASYWSRDVSAVLFNGNGTVGNKWTAGTCATLIIDSIQNDVRAWLLAGRATANITDMKSSIRAMIWYAMCSSITEQTHASFTYTGAGWAVASQTWFSGGSAQQTSGVGDKVDIAVTGTDFVLFTRGTSIVAALATIKVDGVTLTTVDNGGANLGGSGASQTGQTSCPLAIPILGLSPGAHTITFERTSGSGVVNIDCIGTLSTTPPLIVVLKQCYMPDAQYTAWGGAPLATNADIDIINGHVDDVIDEFVSYPNVVSVDFNSNGWDRTTMTGVNSINHPNDRGYALITDETEAVIRANFTDFTLGYNRL
jgi:hypothetical protein